MTPLRDDLVDALKRHPMTCKQAAEAVGTTPRIAQPALNVLCEKGVIRRHGFLKEKRSSILFEVVDATNSRFTRAPKEAA
ncbi:MAG: hypothetical protein WAM90_12740 [Rhodanobacter sp.]